MYLLDTNVVSEFRKAGSGSINKGVEQWADGLKELLQIQCLFLLSQYSN